jgi:hypothetical protein
VDGGAGCVAERAAPAAQRPSEDQGDACGQNQQEEEGDELPEADRDQKAEHEEAETADRDRATAQLRALSGGLEGCAGVLRNRVFQGARIHWYPRFTVFPSVRETGVQTFVPGPPEVRTGKKRRRSATKGSKEVAN